VLCLICHQEFNGKQLSADSATLEPTGLGHMGMIGLNGITYSMLLVARLYVVGGAAGAVGLELNHAGVLRTSIWHSQMC